MPKVVRIGTRGSELALWQARKVAELLAANTDVQCELVIIHTAGDQDRSRPLHEVGGSGFFTKELQHALRKQEVDIVVHSLKDLPTVEPEGLELGAICSREDPAELLLLRPEAAGEGPLGLRAGAVVGTSSLRRTAQLLGIQPNLRIKPLRGNVPTRIRKLRERQYDAILLAYAGVHRLGIDLSGLLAQKLPLELFLPAPAQGALGVEIRNNDPLARELVVSIHERSLAEEVEAERQVLVGLGGGCHIPLGAYCQKVNGSFHLRAVLGTLNADLSLQSLVRAQANGPTPQDVSRSVLQVFRGDQHP